MPSWREGGGELGRTWGGGQDDRLGGERFLYILVGDTLWHLMSLGEHNICKNGLLQGYCKYNLVRKWFKQMAQTYERWSFLPERNGLNKTSVLCK